MSTFCRITGKSRGLPKPNYFPLLPPISPADAKRFCRITGKSYGLPGHHYIPVILFSKSKKIKGKCKITNNEATHKFTPEIENKENRRRHVYLADYRYVLPIIDGPSDAQKLMTELLSTKNGTVIASIEDESRFVYSVEERRCNLVFNSAMEAAVRDGDIRDIMLAKESDTIVFKLKKGNDVSLDFKTVIPKINKSTELFEGEGPTAEVVKEIEKEEKVAKKRKRKRPEGLDSMKKIFEEKEREAEQIVEKEVELAELKKAKVAEAQDKSKKVTLKNEDTDVITEEEERSMLNNWRKFDPRHSRADTSLVMCSGDWRDLIKPLIEDWDWDSFENEAQADSRIPIITTLPEPVPLQAQVLDLGTASPGIVQSQNIGTSGQVGGFEPIPSVAPFTPLIAEPNEEVQEALVNLKDSKILAKTSDVKNVLVNGGDNVKSLIPKVNEIPELISKLETGVATEIGQEKNNKIHGLLVDIESAKRFVAGQTVETPSGPIFIPGQTLHTQSGPAFVPGFTVKTPCSEMPVLIPGQKVLAVTEESGGYAVPVFVAGQTLVTREGEKFVAGQTIQTAEGPRFMAGQTVITPDGPKFIPGQLVTENITVPSDETVTEGEVKTPTYKFIPGQTIMASEGPKFVPGQTVATAHGEEIFIAGQSVQTKGGEWEFVPGQAVEKEGELKFVAGQSVMTPEGPKFIPGQIVRTAEGSQQFVPGVTVVEDGSSRFVPGKVVETPDGIKFVEGQLLKSSSGKTTFVPGKTEVREDKNINFSAAKKIEEIILEEVIKLPEEGLKPINPCPGISPTRQMSTKFGHVVQTSHGVEFFPGHSTSGLPAGKIVPGKLEKAVDGQVKFVPGTVIEIEPGTEKFVPGQVVMTEQGEQFVPGQVVETSEGAKFVPGQIVETRTGQKFVPGQTMETPEGTKFVPGQIVDTKAGPTFIPGQVISTEEGSKFVPGEVVDTEEGPHFVPGRVVETEENKVKFVPGQIVKTKDGKLRFVAPDLQDTPEGHFEFSVQGFEITPEELQILRPIQVTASFIPSSGCEMSIDSKMLQQMSQAGMSLGRQVSLDVPSFELNARDERRILQKSKLNKVDILKDIISEQHTEEMIMEKLSAVLKQNDESEVPEKKQSKKANAREVTLQSAFKHLTQGNPDFLERVLQRVAEQVEELDTEKGATEALQKAIVSVVQENSDKRIKEMLKDELINGEKDENYREEFDQGGLKGLLLQAVGLARALGMSEVVSGLLDVVSDPQSTQLLAHDQLTMEILRRLTVMRQLAEQNPSLCLALRKLQNDPDIAKTDPRLRELVRESAALMVVPEEDYLPLESSKDIPNTLLHSNNILAMEEFLFSRNTRSTGTLLILKQGIQAIIPRENARGVLTGKIPYTVLDETGIRHFEPLHVFSAMRLPKEAANHWRIYCCPVAKEEKTSSECSSYEDLYSKMNTTTTTTSRRRGTLDSVDGSTLNYTRLNGFDDTYQSLTSGYNTPSSKCGSRHGRRYDTLDSTRSNTPSGYNTPTPRTNGSSPVSGETTPTHKSKSYGSNAHNYKKMSRGLDLGSEVS